MERRQTDRLLELKLSTAAAPRRAAPRGAQRRAARLDRRPADGQIASATAAVAAEEAEEVVPLW